MKSLLVTEPLKFVLFSERDKGQFFTGTPNFYLLKGVPAFIAYKTRRALLVAVG